MTNTNLVLKVNGLKEKKIFSIIFFSVLLILVEIPFIILTALFSVYHVRDWTYTFINSIFCIFFGISVITFWIGSAILIKNFKLGKKDFNPKKQKQYYTFTIYVIILSFFFFAITVLIASQVRHEILEEMKAHIAIYYLIDNFMAFSCLLLIFMFHSTKSSGSKTSQKKNSEVKHTTSLIKTKD